MWNQVSVWTWSAIRHTWSYTLNYQIRVRPHLVYCDRTGLMTGVNLAKRRCVLHTFLCEESMRWDRFRQLILTLPRHWGRFTMTAADNKLYPISCWKRKSDGERERIDNYCLWNSAVKQCVWFCDRNFCLSNSNYYWLLLQGNEPEYAVLNIYFASIWTLNVF